MIKGYIYGAILVLIISSGIYALRTWHYIPLGLLQENNGLLKKDLIEQTTLLGICEVKIHKVNIDGFIVIDFDNLTY